MCNVKSIVMSVFFSIVIPFGPLVMPVLAGDLDSPAAPSDPGSAMFTLEAIYNRLDAGTPGSKRTGAFTEPTSGPGSTGRTLDEVMGKAPSVDAANGAGVADVLSDKTFWGLTSGAWGSKTGTMTNRGAGSTITPGTSDQTIAAGYWSSANTVSGDADLVEGNIRSGVTIFSVEGDSNVVDTSSGDAVTGDILSGKKAFVGGNLVTGERHGGCDACSGTLNGTRWCDNGDGTVTDMTTCLVWLKYADWGGVKPWRNVSTDCIGPDATCYDDAHRRAGILKDGTPIIEYPAVPSHYLSDGSVEGDWRLPTKTELVGITIDTEPVSSGQPRAFINVQSSYYWSSSTYADNTRYAWCLGLLDGGVDLDYKSTSLYVWPVRSGN